MGKSFFCILLELLADFEIFLFAYVKPPSPLGSKLFLMMLYLTCSFGTTCGRALCRIKLLPVTHVFVDTWMLTVKPVYKLLNVSDD